MPPFSPGGGGSDSTRAWSRELPESDPAECATRAIFSVEVARAFAAASPLSDVRLATRYTTAATLARAAVMVTIRFVCCHRFDLSREGPAGRRAGGNRRESAGRGVFRAGHGCHLRRVSL